MHFLNKSQIVKKILGFAIGFRPQQAGFELQCSLLTLVLKIRTEMLLEMI